MKKSVNGELVDLTSEEEEIWQQQGVEREARAVELAKIQYQRDRLLEYPSVGDQLDKIYHEGLDAWKADMVDPIKAKYPKPE